jgi:methylthioribose-1-phosphate isomerase
MPVPWKDATPLSGAAYSAVELASDNARVFILDQLALPTQESYRSYVDVAGVAHAIRSMEVRGAPAIGITAAYGMALAARQARDAGGEVYVTNMAAAAETLCGTRPTAVNLSWAVGQAMDLARTHAAAEGESRWRAQSELARGIHRDDVAACRTMGAIGARRLEDGASVLTHCNAGALATGGYGTALGVIRGARDAGKSIHVIATETRPYLQGARLTAWELSREDIPVTVISDNMVAHCMAEGRIAAVVVGADRIANNGDVANKIGTYGIACLAQHHGIPFYVAAPWSTVDRATAGGAGIEIEQRAPEELSHLAGRQLVPDAARIYNPAFDVTPGAMITAIFTERGEFAPAAIAEWRSAEG